MEPRRGAIPTQLLFVEAEGPVVEIDGIVLEPWPEARLEPGTPVHLSLTRPGGQLLRSLVASVLAEWAEGGQIVALELRPVAGSQRVAVSNGDATVTLQLAGAA